MKFNYIIGNPPYQYPKGVKDKAQKLYFEISKIAFDLLKDNGEMVFLTPKNIIRKAKTNIFFDDIKNTLTLVDYTADDYFNVGTSIVLFKVEKRNRDEIVVIDETGSRIENDIEKCVESKLLLTLDILNKVNYEKNGRNKLPVRQTSKKEGPSNTVLKKLSENPDLDVSNLVEVICNTKKDEIRYTEKENITPSMLREKFIIRYSGGIEKGCFITDKPVNQFFFTLKDEIDKTEWYSNIKSYIDSKLIRYCLSKQKDFHTSIGYDFISKLPEIDLSKKWTDEKLYEEFNLTDEEIEEVEKWYEKWKNKSKTIKGK